MTNIRVALVGFGLAGQAFHSPLIDVTDGLQLSCVVTSQTAAVRTRYPGVRIASCIEDVLADTSIDLVVIATPDELHCAQTIAALGAGKHVVVDKPFALGLEQAHRMAAAAEATGKMLTVFHNRRWDADFRTLCALIDAGTLGTIMQFESHFDRFRAEPLNRWKDRRLGGVWQDLGPHLVDQALQLFGAPDFVLADIATQKAQAPDYAHVTLGYATLRVILHMSQAMPDHALRFAVHGSGGSYIKAGLDPQEAQAVAGGSPRDDDWGLDPSPGSLTLVNDGQALAAKPWPNQRGDYSEFYRMVRDAILGTAENPAPPDQALAVMSVIEAGLRSAREGCVVRLD